MVTSAKVHRLVRPMRFIAIIGSMIVFFVPVMSIAQGFRKPAVVVDFSIPDTACVNQSVPITNLSQGASTYSWRFCSGNAVTNPNGIDTGNPSNTLNAPWGITLVQNGRSCFAFVTNSGDSTITRVYWQNGLMNPPTAVKLGNFSILNHDVFGIQVKQDNGNWFGFVANGTSLVRLDFGASLLNPSPLTTKFEVAPATDNLRGLVIEKDGNDWVGFSTNWPSKTITRYHWQNSLSSTPAITNLGNIGGLTDPMQPALIRDNIGWYLFIANTTSLSQLDFGNSLLNNPTGTNLGNFGTMTDDRGLCLLMECNNPYGLIVNHNLVANVLLQLHFIGGLAGSKAITPLGVVSNLYLPSALSEAVIIGDTIFTVALNEHSLTTLFFPPCTNMPIPVSTQFDPSPVVFTNPGTYTISLTVDLGLATEQRICKEIEIDAPRPFSLGNDTTICEGADLVLTPGNGYKSYLWNTGAISPSIQVNQPGYYSVTVTSFHDCQLTGTVYVDVSQYVHATVDTSICWGQKYLAGGKYQTTGGTYFDTLIVQLGCKKIITTNLSIRPEIIVDLGKDTVICNGIPILLSVHPENAICTWQDGSHDSSFLVVTAGVYWIKLEKSGCFGSDSVIVAPCPPEESEMWVPNAFSPNGDGINDIFRATGLNVIKFNMDIYDRWGGLVFQTNDIGQGWPGNLGGKQDPSGIYTYSITWERYSFPGETLRKTGTFMLVR